MKTLINAAALSAVLIACVASSPAVAGKYDGSIPVVCTMTAVHECAAGALCLPRNAESVNFATQIRIDAAAKKVNNIGGEKASAKESVIQTASHQNNALILTGAEFGRGWIMVVHEDSGRLSGAVSGDGDGFVLFGQCALP